MALVLISSPLSDRVETVVKAYVENNFPMDKAEYQYDFRRINWAILPADADSAGVLRIGKDSPLGNTIFTLGFFNNGNLEKVMPVSIGVTLLVDALITTTPVNIGEGLHGFTLSRRNVTGRGELPLTDSTFLENKIATQYIPAGSIIFNSLAEERPLISPGDKVSIIFEKGALKITANGVARQKGTAGETIRVVNLGSKKIINAMVIDSLTVAVK